MITMAGLDTENHHLITANSLDNDLPITATSATTDITNSTIYALNTTTPDGTTMGTSATASTSSALNSTLVP